MKIYKHIFLSVILVCMWLGSLFLGLIIFYWIDNCFDYQFHLFFPTPLEYLPAPVLHHSHVFLNPLSPLSSFFVDMGLGLATGMKSLSGNAFLEKSDSHSICSHQLPISSQLMVATHEHFLLPCYDFFFGRSDLTNVLSM